MEAYSRPRPSSFGTPRPGLIDRAGFATLDPILLFAGVGLIAYSIYTLGVATQHDVPGDPYYYVVRQSIYAVVGIALMLVFAVLLPTVDPVSLVLEAVPLILLFELSIQLAVFMEKRWDIADQTSRWAAE